MAATYGYSGEFSSDEEIDKIEQQTERLGKFDPFVQSKGPSKDEVEEAIESIKRLADESNFAIADDLLGGILDHYKTQRGPIVDSTRGLYKKIVLRLVRGVQATNGDSNGNGIMNSNNNNNNNENNIDKRHEFAASSDEDEPMPPASDQRPKFGAGGDNAEPMEIDSMSANGPMRNTKPIDLPTTDEEEEEEEEEDEEEDEDEDDEEATEDEENSATEESDSDEASDSEEQGDQLKQGVEKLIVTGKSKAPAKPTASKSNVEPTKKPYTRSQRVAATRLSSSSLRSMDTRHMDSAFIEQPGRNYNLITGVLVSILLAIAAALVYQQLQLHHLI